jgi:hypothetical protein
VDDVSKVCANCRLHKVFFDEYGFDGWGFACNLSKSILKRKRLM